MSTDPEVLQLLGRIDGKLDSVIASALEHRADDSRRFADVYDKLDEHSDQISKAQGAKGVILWMVGGGAAAISAFISLVFKAKGGS